MLRDWCLVMLWNEFAFCKQISAEANTFRLLVFLVKGIFSTFVFQMVDYTMKKYNNTSSSSDIGRDSIVFSAPRINDNMYAHCTINRSDNVFQCFLFAKWISCNGEQFIFNGNMCVSFGEFTTEMLSRNKWHWDSIDNAQSQIFIILRVQHCVCVLLLVCIDTFHV